ncbi:MAG: hypothetical protein ACT4P3_05585 [Betaproteobacteria bacterium]
MKKLPPHPTSDELVDENVEESFPASDPAAASQPASRAQKLSQRARKPPAPASQRKRSPDWMFEKK